MTKVLEANVYDYPEYYDLIFNTGWRVEYGFLTRCFARYARSSVRRVFEPACGSGRLLVKFGADGYEVSGNDLNPRAVGYCNARLTRQNVTGSVRVGDMADFRLPRKVDAAFNLINTFRHLPTERAAENHLHCVARALRKGGVFVLGLHLTPRCGQQCVEETWSTRRGKLAVVATVWSIDVNLRRRRETVGMAFDIRTPSRRFRLRDEFIFRTYTAAQMRNLLGRVPELALIETYDFTYDLDEPMAIDDHTEDVIFVLRKR